MKKAVRLITDALMTVLLLCLMSYQVTGDVLHEWIGMGMTLLLIVHNILNAKWYASLFKGKYNAYRTVTVTVNILLLAAIFLTTLCGMSMSAYAVPFLYGMTNIIFARTAHLALSYWAFILMGFHIGMHMPAMTRDIRLSKPWRTVLTALFSAAAAAGLWFFIRNGIAQYLLFRTHFAFFDYSKSAFAVFAENAAVMFLFVFCGANTVRFIIASHKKKATDSITQDT